MRSGVLLAAITLAAGVPAVTAHAGDAPADSLLHAYVRSMSDSTDAWFGMTASPVDTAGLDSSLAVGLANGHGLPGFRRSRHGLELKWSPALGFNRADGGQLGAGLDLRTLLPGEFSGRAQYTTGMRDVIGSGGWGTSWSVAPLHARAAFQAAAGRWTEAFDRDHWQPLYSSLRAFYGGDDRNHYLRRDGFTTGARLSADRSYSSLGWRRQRESPLRFTTRWSLRGGEPELRFVDRATRGTVSEAALEQDLTVPGTRVRVNAAYANSDPRIGSEFRYRRTRLLAGGDVSLGRHLALVPQAAYGRLRGDALPQDAFFLGGTGTLRTLRSNALAGTGQAFARVDLVLADDLGPLLHLPLPLWLPLQAGVFVASGALWGRDPASGTARAIDRNSPRRGEWMTEIGGGVSWRPGIPDPQTALRLEYTVPVGAHAHDTPDAAGQSRRLTLALQRTLNLLPMR